MLGEYPGVTPDQNKVIKFPEKRIDPTKEAYEKALEFIAPMTLEEAREKLQALRESNGDKAEIEDLARKVKLVTITKQTYESKHDSLDEKPLSKAA